MRPHALALAFSLALSAGCGDEREAVLDYTVMDATPAVPLRALQVFQVGPQGTSNGGIAMVWGDDVGMPDSGSVSFRGDLPPPFRLCAVALARDDDQLFHARSEPVELVLDETFEVVLTLAPVEADSGVPAPCGAEVQPWPTACERDQPPQASGSSSEPSGHCGTPSHTSSAGIQVPSSQYDSGQ